MEASKVASASPPATLGRPPDPQRLQRRSLVELLVGYGLLLLVLWTPRPWQESFYLVALTFFVVLTWRSFRSLPVIGLRRTNLFRSSWVVAGALLIAAVAVPVSFHLHLLHPVGSPLALLRRYWSYAIWAFFQQVLLLDFSLRRLLSLFSGRRGAATIGAAAIFSLAHLPNPILAPATFVWGLVCCWVFLRYRNLWPLAVAHAILGITLSLTMPASVVRGMRVGLGYLTHPLGHSEVQRKLSGAVSQEESLREAGCALRVAPGIAQVGVQAEVGARLGDAGAAHLGRQRQAAGYQRNACIA